MAFSGGSRIDLQVSFINRQFYYCNSFENFIKPKLNTLNLYIQRIFTSPALLIE